MSIVNRSWAVGRFFGIDVKVHSVFVLYIAASGAIATVASGLLAGLHQTVLTVMLFGCVVVHEFGHALTARYFGVQTIDIMLYPFGGAASLERMPQRPSHELIIALAGPLTSMVLAGAMLPGLAIIGTQTDTMGGNVLMYLATVNAILAGFNLVPAYPLDGGRIVRGLLGMRYSFVRSVRLAVRISRCIACLFIGAGFWFGVPAAIIMGVLILLFGRIDADSRVTNYLLENSRVTDAMTTGYVIARPDQLLVELGQGFAPTTKDRSTNVVVFEGQNILGAHAGVVLDKAPSDMRAQDRLIGVAMTIPPSMLLGEAVELLRSGNHKCLFVVNDQGRLLGLFTALSFVMYMEAASRGKVEPAVQ